MPNIERRRNLWYATLTIPQDVRDRLGKFKFIQSLGTPDKREAQRLAPPLVAKWKATIRQARGEQDAITTEAMRWKASLSRATGDDRDSIELVLTDRAEELEKAKGFSMAKSFYDLASGISTPSNTYYEEWKGHLDLAPKTIDQMAKDVTLMVNKFPTLEEITKQNLKKWMDDLSSKGTTPSSQKRIVSFCRNYWRYLMGCEAVPAESDPFSGVLAISKGNKRNTKASWKPFDPADVVTLWNEANKKKKDQQLADLIILGAYTGARIEELCSVKMADVNHSSFRIVDAKTGAGVREVPIHSAIADLVERLKKETKDEYLLSGLTFNKYGDRSNAIGKRFGALKTRLGFDEEHVFHSIRKTLTTLLENAGVSENLAADIVGHEKPRITYGLYSGGASLAVKKEAIEKVHYPFP